MSYIDVQVDFVFEDGNEEHDGKAQQNACVLEQEESTVAEAMVPCVVVQHLRNLEAAAQPFLILHWWFIILYLTTEITCWKLRQGIDI